MKNIITFLAAVLITATSCTAQVKNPKTETVKVWGNCSMCKETIEKAANKKGDAKAVWNDETKQATITYNTKTTNLNTVLKRIALAGYDNAVYAAPNEAYNNLAGCCQYDRPDKKEIKAPTTAAANTTTETPTKKEETKPSSLQTVYDAYFDLKDALIKSDATIAATKAATLLKAINAIKMETLGSNHMAYMNVEKDLKLNAEHISESKDIAHQRDHFSALSTAMYQLMKTAKANTTVYYEHCPMYNDGKGANWLSKDAAIKNPYYGSMMLTCGKVQETIKQ
ncbi:DUF3347 domain-containing protein [bacterium]|nr:DUF3347 domain-containing protein [bacterium]